MRRLLLLIASCAILLAGCGDEDHFRVKGTVDGKATMNIRVGYYSDGAFRTILTAAREGEFQFEGSAPEGTVVDLYDHEYRLLGRFYGRNGTDYDLGVVRGKPFAMSMKADGAGSDVAGRFSSFLASEADSLTFSPNGPVGRYVRANPADVVSTLLLTTLYDAHSDPVGADSLLESIDPQARPSTLTAGFQDLLRRVLAAYPVPDTLVFRTTSGGRDTLLLKSHPLTLFMADNRHTERQRLVHMMKQLHKDVPSSKLRIVEVSLDTDTSEWKRSIARDTATWTQTWTPGSLAGPLADRLAIERLPHFLVVDSAGTVLYRGSLAESAREAATHYIIR